MTTYRILYDSNNRWLDSHVWCSQLTIGCSFQPSRLPEFELLLNLWLGVGCRLLHFCLFLLLCLFLERHEVLLLNSANKNYHIISKNNIRCTWTTGMVSCTILQSVLNDTNRIITNLPVFLFPDSLVDDVNSNDVKYVHQHNGSALPYNDTGTPRLLVFWKIFIKNTYHSSANSSGNIFKPYHKSRLLRSVKQPHLAP